MKWIKIQTTKEEKEKIKSYQANVKLRTFIKNLHDNKDFLDKFIEDNIKNKIELTDTNDSITFTLSEDLDIFFSDLVHQHDISKTNFIRYYINTLKEKSEFNSGETASQVITTLTDKRTKEKLIEKAAAIGVSLNYLIEESFEDYTYKKVNTRNLKNDQKITLNCTKTFKEGFIKKAEGSGVSASLLLRTFLHHLKNQEEIKL